MKDSLVALALAGLALAANADCSVTSVRDTDTGNKFKRHGGWTFEEAKFNQLCAKLNRANARIQINAQSAVLVNQSIGWAVLSVLDANTGVATSDFASTSTQVNSYASQDKADELMVLAINNAARDWDGIDKALAALEQERKRVREAFRASSHNSR